MLEGSTRIRGPLTDGQGWERRGAVPAQQRTRMAGPLAFGFDPFFACETRAGRSKLTVGYLWGVDNLADRP